MSGSLTVACVQVNAGPEIEPNLRAVGDLILRAREIELGAASHDIAPGDVARAEPSVGREALARRLGVAPVAGRDVGAAIAHLGVEILMLAIADGESSRTVIFANQRLDGDRPDEVLRPCPEVVADVDEEAGHAGLGGTRATRRTTGTRATILTRCALLAVATVVIALVVLRSTVYPGTTAYVTQRLKEAGCSVDVAFCPERIAEGRLATAKGYAFTGEDR